MILKDIRGVRAGVSRQAMTRAFIHVNATWRKTYLSIEDVRPIWFALLTCEERELKLLWKNSDFKRWWAKHSDLVAGSLRLAPQAVIPTHETPVP